MSMKIKFLRVGSDPEFVFVQREEGEIRIEASTIIGTNKARTTQSFIGTDNHSQTGELRPTPAHNIRLHLVGIAAGLDGVYRYLESKPEMLGIEVMANPHIYNEPLGGHIHVSFIAPLDQYTQLLRGKNIWYNNIPSQGSFLAIDNNRDRGPLNAETVATIRSAVDVNMVSPLFVKNLMAWFLEPLELWVQPWYSRTRRFASYGPGEPIRPGVSDAPPGVSQGYHHWEYRLPSTWLVHPWLAYTYLSLTKIVMVNTQLISKIAGKEMKHALYKPAGDLSPGQPIPKKEKPRNQLYFTILRDRLESLSKAGGRITNDAADIHAAIDYCSEHRRSWWENPTIRIDEWRKLL